MSTVADWVDTLQASGRYSFLRSELPAATGLPGEAVKKALQRLARQRRVVKVKRYFFVIVPIEYRNAGGPPPSWFIDDLMKAMQTPYYVGLLSAAAIHGASHQQPQEFQVVTDRPVRTLEVGRGRIRFVAYKHLANVPVQNVKTATGTMRVSTPEATAVNLVRFARVAGHIDNVATVLAELAGTLSPKKLLAAVRSVDDLPGAQRLGFLLDAVGAERQANTLHRWLDRQSLRHVPLRQGRPANDGERNERWRVSYTQAVEIDR